MIIVDANLLIYAYNERSPFCSSAKLWLEDALSSNEEMGIPVQAVLAFIRISTNARLPGPHSTTVEAIARIDAVLACSTARLLHPGPAHWPIFSQLCVQADVAGNLTTDAHIAALAIEHNATLCTTDRDFARFPGLRWRNPLIG